RLLERPHAGPRIAREPETVADRVEHEDQEDEEIRGDQDDAPDLPRGERSRGSGRPGASGFFERERRHRDALLCLAYPSLRTLAPSPRRGEGGVRGSELRSFGPPHPAATAADLSP